MDIVDKFYHAIHNNQYTSTIISTFLVLYGSSAAPKLPNIFKILFNNPFFNIIFLGLIGYSINRDPKLSIFLSIIFTLVIKLLENHIEEGFSKSKNKISKKNI